MHGVPRGRAPRFLRTIASAALAAATCASTQAQVKAEPDRFGDTLRFGLPLAAVALSLYEDDAEGLKQFAISMAVSQVATDGLKRAVHSKRPDGTGHGFPSGHASMTFTAATYVHQRYSLAGAIPFYALAAATAAHRTRTHHHTTSQALAGALIGSASSWLFSDRLAAGRSRTALGYVDRTLLVSYEARW